MARTFRIYETGSFTDPAHLIKAVELNSYTGKVIAAYSSLSVIKDLIAKCERETRGAEGDSDSSGN